MTPSSPSAASRWAGRTTSPMSRWMATLSFTAWPSAPESRSPSGASRIRRSSRCRESRPVRTRPCNFWSAGSYTASSGSGRRRLPISAAIHPDTPGFDYVVYVRLRDGQAEPVMCRDSAYGPATSDAYPVSTVASCLYPTVSDGYLITRDQIEAGQTGDRPPDLRAADRSGSWPERKRRLNDIRWRDDR